MKFTFINNEEGPLSAFVDVRQQLQSVLLQKQHGNECLARSCSQLNDDVLVGRLVQKLDLERLRIFKFTRNILAYFLNVSTGINNKLRGEYF